MKLEGILRIVDSLCTSSSNKDILTTIFYFWLNTVSENSYKLEGWSAETLGFCVPPQCLAQCDFISAQS